MINIDQFASGLELVDKGVWASRSSSKVSYPERAHDGCFELEAESFWFKHRNNCLIEAVKRFPPPGVLFDVGGGNGFVTLGLCNSGIDAVLVEPGTQGVGHARSRGLSPIICSTLADAGFRRGSLPGIGLFDVLEHIECDIGFLKMVKSLLCRNGRLYIAVPAHNFLWSGDDVSAGHYRRYTIDGLVRKLSLAELCVEYSTYFFCMLPPLVFMFRTLPTKLGISRRRPGRSQAEHRQRGGLVGKALNKFLEYELATIRRGGRVPWGGSCLVVSRQTG